MEQILKHLPTIHTIDSIKIDIYSREHLPPHFHAIYAEFEILIEIKNIKVYAGSFPAKQYRTVTNWAKEEKVKAFLLTTFEQLNPNLRK